MEGPPPPESFDGVDCVFHLAGESVAEGRWTTAQKATIRDSRILGTKNLVSGILQNKTGIKTLVSSSAVGYYGDRGEEELTESSPPEMTFSLMYVLTGNGKQTLLANKVSVLSRCGQGSYLGRVVVH